MFRYASSPYPNPTGLVSPEGSGVGTVFPMKHRPTSFGLLNDRGFIFHCLYTAPLNPTTTTMGPYLRNLARNVLAGVIVALAYLIPPIPMVLRYTIFLEHDVPILPGAMVTFFLAVLVITVQPCLAPRDRVLFLYLFLIYIRPFIISECLVYSNYLIS